MELNGVANIKMIVDRAVEDNSVSTEIAGKILNQLDLLNRYMVAAGETFEYNDEALCEHTQPMEIPYWHQIIADRESYLTLAEKQESFKEHKGLKGLKEEL